MADAPILIAGGGPAGATLAALLARGGHPVCLLEKLPEPKHKVCGEFLSPASWRLFDRLELSGWLDDLPVPRMTHALIAGRRQHMLRPLPADAGRHAFGLSRFILDDLLRQRARALGADLRSGWLVRKVLIAQDDRGSHVRGLLVRSPDGQDIELPAHCVIVADGKAVGLASEEATPASGQLGVKFHLVGVPALPQRCIELYSFARGYVGLSPIEGGRWNCCAAVDAQLYQTSGHTAEAMFEHMRRANPAFAERVASAQLAIEPLVCPLPRYPLRPPTVRGLHRIGNAAGAFDPFIGEGMFAAMAGGQALADLLMKHSPSLAAWPTVNTHLTNQLSDLLRTRRASGRLFCFGACRPRLFDAALSVLNAVPTLADATIRFSGKPARA